MGKNRDKVLTTDTLRTCSVKGCFRKHCARGYCSMHWQRWRTNVPLDLPPKFQSLNAKGWIMGGYRWVSTPDRGEVLEHRYKMEKHLGRLLDTDEVVHHKNGDKLDNRLANLELKSRAEHMVEHRGHRVGECLVCSKSDLHGTRGLCGMHANRVKRIKDKFGVVTNDGRLGDALVEMGIALALESPEVQKRLSSLYGSGDVTKTGNMQGLSSLRKW